MEERLRKFAALVDAGGFTKAAAALHVSQPALSTAVAKLEFELKATLLVRGARPLALTRAGELAYQSAKDVAVQTDNLKLRLAELASLPIPLRIGMIDSVAAALFAGQADVDVLTQPTISIIVNNSRYLSEAVERGDLDIAFITQPVTYNAVLLEIAPFVTESLVVVGLAGRSSLSARRLPNFISYDQPSHTFRIVQRALQAHGVTPDISFYSTSPEVMLRLVMLGKGVAALPYSMIKEHLDAGRLVCLGDPKPWVIPRPVVMLKRRDRELPKTLTQLAHQFVNVFEVPTFEP